MENTAQRPSASAFAELGLQAAASNLESFDLEIIIILDSSGLLFLINLVSVMEEPRGETPRPALLGLQENSYILLIFISFHFGF